MTYTSQVDRVRGHGEPETERATGSRPTAARVSLVATATFLVLLAALHAIKPELDPSWRVISEYAIGDFGWVMVLAFLSLAVGCIALFAAIRSELRTIGGKVGLAFLLLGAAGLIIAAIFTTDPIAAGPGEATADGDLHAAGAALGTGIPLAAAFIGRSLRRNPAWSSARRSLFWSAVLAWAGFVAFSLSTAILLPQNDGKGGPDAPIGWPNRLMMLAYAGWVITVAWHAARPRRA